MVSKVFVILVFIIKCDKKLLQRVTNWERETEREGEGERKKEKDRQGESFTNFQIILTKCDSYYKVR